MRRCRAQQMLFVAVHTIVVGGAETGTPGLAQRAAAGGYNWLLEASVSWLAPPPVFHPSPFRVDLKFEKVCRAEVNLAQQQQWEHSAGCGTDRKETRRGPQT